MESSGRATCLVRGKKLRARFVPQAVHHLSERFRERDGVLGLETGHAWLRLETIHD
jgi:hypothetical protein